MYIMELEEKEDRKQEHEEVYNEVEEPTPKKDVNFHNGSQVSVHAFSAAHDLKG